jgi:hypothetical protein
MGKTAWRTPAEGTAIIAGQMLLVRAFPVELHQLVRLDDDLLTKLERETITRVKNGIFNPGIDGATQIHLMDYSIGAIREGLRYIRECRDKGLLQRRS